MLLLPIAQVARKTGVTSRTLRHYDAIGLLPPADTAADGRRYYGEQELLRLQHILILKELGVDLATTARVLDAAPDHAVGLLKDHLKALTKERDRFARLAATVSRTIDHLEEETAMTTDEMFEGFKHTQYEPEARERWGDAAVDSSNANWERMGAEGKRRHMEIDRELVEARGYYGTGLNDVLAASGAPRGSLYFHFPAGKDEMVALALTEAGQDIGALLAGAAGTAATPAQAVRRLLEVLGDRMEESGYAKGCPVATVALETAAGHELVLKDPAPLAWMMSFGDSTLDFELRVFVAEINQRNVVRTELMMRIAETFAAKDIEIAFPQRDVWLRTPVQLDGGAERATEPTQPAASADAINASKRA